MATKKFYKQLRKLNIDPESKLGKYLERLDDKYAELEDKQKEIKKYLKNKQWSESMLRYLNKLYNDEDQLKEDVEMMEYFLMYKFNRDTRLNRDTRMSGGQS